MLKSAFTVNGFLLGAILSVLLCMNSALADVGKYLPIDLPADVSVVLDNVMILAGDPVIKRPITVERVRSAIDKAKDKHPARLTLLVKYLERFESAFGVTSASVSASSSGEKFVRPLAQGESFDSNYRVALSGYIQPSSWLNINLGGYSFDDPVNESNSSYLNSSYLSLFGGHFQLDVGMRDHWFGPFQSADMLVSTQAANAPSVTLSNVVPFSQYGVYYEFFYAQLSESDSILNRETGLRESGNPKLFGFHLSVNPFDGFAIGVNRLLQYGGASRDESASGLFGAFFSIKTNDNSGIEGNDFGNQLSSITTQFTFDSGVPLSIYMEYAGEDTSYASEVHIGNTSMMAGFRLPSFAQSYDFTYEYANWQNSWYTNGNYGDGLSNDGLYIGHWAASASEYNSSSGVDSHYVKIGSQLSLTSYLSVEFRSAKSGHFGSGEAWSMELLGIQLMQRWREHRFELNLDVGRERDERFSVVSGVWRW